VESSTLQSQPAAISSRLHCHKNYELMVVDLQSHAQVQHSWQLLFEGSTQGRFKMKDAELAYVTFVHNWFRLIPNFLRFHLREHLTGLQ
jgi:hypothetical protein